MARGRYTQVPLADSNDCTMSTATATTSATTTAPVEGPKQKASPTTESCGTLRKLNEKISSELTAGGARQVTPAIIEQVTACPACPVPRFLCDAVEHFRVGFELLPGTDGRRGKQVALYSSFVESNHHAVIESNNVEGRMWQEKRYRSNDGAGHGLMDRDPLRLCKDGVQ